MKLKRRFNLIRVFTQIRGFTLVELMVVVSIIGILVAIAIPIYRNNTAASERIVVEANLRTLDSAIMHYVVAEGVYPVDNSNSDSIEWIIKNPSWNKENKLEPFVSPFSSIKGERYVIYGASSAPVTINSNRAFIVLSDGDTIGGYTATGDEHYHLQNLPWKQSKPSVLSHILQWGDGSFTLSSSGITDDTPTSGQTLGGSYEGADNSIIIPKELNGKILKQINQRVFEGKGLTSVIFDEDSEINRIHGHAFRDNNLKEIIFPDTLKRIDGNSFRNNQLQEVILPDSVTTVEQDAFRDNKITKIEIGNNVALGNFAFQNNPVEVITIGEGVTLGDQLIKQHSNEFKDVYERDGAGTYKLVNGQWVKQ